MTTDHAPNPERIAAARQRVLEEVMNALKQERGRMTRGNGYTLANVYGMNNAVDIVAKMIGEASGD